MTSVTASFEINESRIAGPQDLPGGEYVGSFTAIGEVRATVNRPA